MSIDRCDMEAVESLLEALVKELTREVDSMQSLFPQMRDSLAVPRKIDVGRGKARVVVGKINIHLLNIQDVIPSYLGAAKQNQKKTVHKGCLVSISLTPMSLRVTADESPLCRPRPRRRNDIRSTARAGLFPIFYLMVSFFLPRPTKGREHGNLGILHWTTVDCDCVVAVNEMSER